MPTPTATASRGRPHSNVDPAKWAALLDEILEANDLAAENAARPNGPIPASAQTVRKWRKAQTGVTADMVRDVCRAMGYPVAHALVAVGWLRPEELGVTGLVPVKLPRAMALALDPLAKRVNAVLTDSRIPAPVRDVLRDFVQGAYDVWVSKYRRRPPRGQEPLIEPRRET